MDVASKIRTGLLMLALLPSVSPAGAAWAAAGNHFEPGYCTWYAAERAHTAWGTWLPWYGDAGDWSAGAQAAGWKVSTAPHAGSIVAMPRYVQGSGGYGHVGWVLGVDEAGVLVESMNWQGYGVVSQHRIVADGQVRFLTPPGTGGADDASDGPGESASWRAQ